MNRGIKLGTTCTFKEMQGATHAPGVSKLGPSNDNDIKIVDWEPQSKKLPESERRTHLLRFTYLLQLSGIVALPLK